MYSIFQIPGGGGEGCTFDMLYGVLFFFFLYSY